MPLCSRIKQKNGVTYSLSVVRTTAVSELMVYS